MVVENGVRLGIWAFLKCPNAKPDPFQIRTIPRYHQELSPAGESTVIFRDSAFANDVVKSNITAILEQYGIDKVRSL